MFLSSVQILILLKSYGYAIIFPIVVLEGPIITVISGFLVSLKIFNAFIIFPLLVIGDVLGDLLHFFLGKYLRRFSWADKISHMLGYNENEEAILEKHLKEHTGRTLLLSKISHGIGGVIQIVAGVSDVSFIDFFKWSIIGTLPKTLFLLIVGITLGSSYKKVDSLLDTIAFVTLAIFILLVMILVSRTLAKREIKKEQKSTSN